jgi:hypothetical protein
MALKIKIIRSVDYLDVNEDNSIDFKESIRKLVELAEPKRPPVDYELLLDFRRTQWILSTEEIFMLIDPVIGCPDSARDKIALLLLPGVNFNRELFNGLCEKTKGSEVRTFTNYEDAIQWLY